MLVKWRFLVKGLVLWRPALRAENLLTKNKRSDGGWLVVVVMMGVSACVVATNTIRAVWRTYLFQILVPPWK